MRARITILVQSRSEAMPGSAALFAAASEQNELRLQNHPERWGGPDRLLLCWAGDALPPRALPGRIKVIRATANIAINSVLLTAESGEAESIGADAMLYTADITMLTADYFG